MTAPAGSGVESKAPHGIFSVSDNGPTVWSEQARADRAEAMLSVKRRETATLADDVTRLSNRLAHWQAFAWLLGAVAALGWLIVLCFWWMGFPTGSVAP
jgi:hypothetical protein